VNAEAVLRVTPHYPIIQSSPNTSSKFDEQTFIVEYSLHHFLEQNNVELSSGECIRTIARPRNIPMESIYFRFFGNNFYKL
jgi:hypothetical protein